VGLVRDELVDEQTRQAAASDFQSLTRPALMRTWHAKWDSADTGRLAHSIFPDVQLQAWFEGQKEKKMFVCTVSRVFFWTLVGAIAS
jgi:hypothetical protein